uniref:Uncharacterized protein n=1 Tax=Arundo donax TaxID=35708 RepID=A0A0A9A390_ARUDO
MLVVHLQLDGFGVDLDADLSSGSRLIWLSC